MTWHGPHFLYNSMKRAQGLLRYLDNNDYDSQRLRMSHVTGVRSKPGPEEYLRRCLLCAYAFARRANISDEGFIRGAQAMIDYIKQHTTTQVTATVTATEDEDGSV